MVVVWCGEVGGCVVEQWRSIAAPEVAGGVVASARRGGRGAETGGDVRGGGVVAETVRWQAVQ